MKFSKTGSRIFLAALLLAMTALPVWAQEAAADAGWQKEVKLGLNVLQSSYSDNWNGGDKGTVNWSGNIDAVMEKQMGPGSNWRNTLKLVYGQSHKQERDGDGQLYWQRPDKTDDIIDFESLFRLTPKGGWDPYASFKFTSMFEDLSDPDGRSLSINPMTFKGALGMSKAWIKTDDRMLMSRLGVAVLQNSRKFYLNPAPDDALQREGSTEVAGELITEYKVGALDGRVDWQSKLTLTLPFTYSGKSTFEDGGFTSAVALPEDIAGYTTSVDVDWENTFSANITKVISVKLFTRWVYDKYDNTVTPVVEDGTLINSGDVQNAIRKAGQFKQTLALGFGYTFH